MSWDWQERLQSEESDPPRGDPAFGRPLAEPSGQQQRPADAGATGQARLTGETPMLPAATGVAGMVWYAMGASRRSGQSPTKDGLPQLLYDPEHKCAFCRGADRMRGAPQCPVCRGTAKVGFTPPMVRCAFCYGGGHIPLRSDATCPACRGSGVITVRPPIQVCTKCRGRGRQTGQSLYCGRCRGSGVVTVSESERPAQRGARSRIETNDRRA